MKDRIRQIMESQHMTQQVFADFIGTTPATLSGIFNDRTRPTINIVESIRKKFPDISLDWLMFGQGDMYKTPPTKEPDLFSQAEVASAAPLSQSQPVPSVTTPSAQTPRTAFSAPSAPVNLDSVRSTLKETIQEEMKNIDKHKRHVLEIRVYYDDGSYESFLPAPR
ncbi:MAG: helix-turn-helix transcriptional regulator [Prevotella sp.]|nr:helix-turn-helix transcriptional regulator [Prevotella sp.]